MNKKLFLAIILIGLLTGLYFTHIGQLEQSKNEKIKNLKLEVNYYGKYLITITEMNEARMTNGKDNTNIFLTRESDEPWFLAARAHTSMEQC